MLYTWIHVHPGACCTTAGTTCRLGAWSCCSFPRRPATRTWTVPRRKTSPASCAARGHWPRSPRWSAPVIWCTTVSWTYARGCSRNPWSTATWVSATRSPCSAATICWPTRTTSCPRWRTKTWALNRYFNLCAMMCGRSEIMSVEI